MIRQKQIWLQFPDDDVEPAPIANVFESDASGNIISAGFYTETDENGLFQYDDSLPINYITSQWQGYKLTLPFIQFNKMQNIVIDVSNTLDEVIITGERPAKYDWIIAGLLFITAKAIQ